MSIWVDEVVSSVGAGASVKAVPSGFLYIAILEKFCVDKALVCRFVSETPFDNLLYCTSAPWTLLLSTNRGPTQFSEEVAWVVKSERPLMNLMSVVNVFIAVIFCWVLVVT